MLTKVAKPTLDKLKVIMLHYRKEVNPMEIFTNVASMASITAIVELIAYAYKTKTSADNKWIPVICMVAGALLGIAAWVVYPAIYPATDAFTACAMGIGSGATAVALYEGLFKTSKK